MFYENRIINPMIYMKISEGVKEIYNFLVINLVNYMHLFFYAINVIYDIE